MNPAPSPRSDDFESTVHTIERLVAELGSGVQVIFVAHRDHSSAPADASNIIDAARNLATAAGLNRWAGWGVAWCTTDSTAAPIAGERGFADLATVLTDLIETGRSNGVILCAVGSFPDTVSVGSVLSAGADQAVAHGLRSAIVDID